MNERISAVRKAVGLTQEKFAEKIGLTRNFVWMIEKGDRVPSDRTVSDICREFNVSETWIREGTGEMFVQRSRNEELAAFFGDVLAADDFRARLLSVMSRLSTEEWELLARMAEKLAEEQKKPTPD